MTEPLIGYRVWRVCPNNFLDNYTVVCKDYPFDLHAISEHWHENTTEFMPGQRITATCSKSRCGCNNPPGFPVLKTVRVFGRGCGIYAYKRLSDALIKPGESVGGGHTFILGKVAMWGKIQEHLTGYRSQFAYPIGFYEGVFAGKNQDYIKELTRNWGVETLSIPDHIRGTHNWKVMYQSNTDYSLPEISCESFLAS